MENETPGNRDDNANPVAPPLPPTASVADASGEPKPPPRSAKKFVVLAVVLLLIIALGSEGYSLLNKSLAAKDVAASSIAAAKQAIAAADPAVEPGSQELTESQKSRSELDEANLLYGEGSVIQTGRYRDAKTKADDARRIAQGITKRVEALATEASTVGTATSTTSADSNAAIALYFTLSQKYPRTPQGQGAITNAAAVLLDDFENSVGRVDAVDLDRIKEFCAECPGDVPTTVYDAAATRIKSIAGNSLDFQAPMVTSNKSWVKKLRAKGANFTILGTAKADTSELTRVIGILPAVEGTRFQAALTLLRDCSRLGERCSKIAQSPVRKNGSARYFSSSQVNEIEKLSKQMDAQLTKARGLLNNL